MNAHYYYHKIDNEMPIPDYPTQHSAVILRDVVLEELEGKKEKRLGAVASVFDTIDSTRTSVVVWTDDISRYLAPASARLRYLIDFDRREYAIFELKHRSDGRRRLMRL
ncbi:hypothetical protein BJ508DRAFT_325541 [Ascobolus immersus RN42]|uniref:Uncharacterized protein n=1 Tax=Ascobolus immersus RN42 TaxID=1160509 RepID=A0A3N4IDF2_ASCIM|nr:hypothetical protein BJ508DRAFT_325541 [Ascobolus immersus RN42]